MVRVPSGWDWPRNGAAGEPTEPKNGPQGGSAGAATPFPSPASPQGWIGGYHLLRKIGTGGTGTVWKAVDEGGNQVALKLLHPSVADTDGARKRLLREARLVNQINSDRVSKVLDVEADAFSPFVVTELIEGKTLDRAVADTPTSAQELHDLAIDLANVLDDVHEANVAHRDLKPSNIVMGPSGPILIDFGIAQSSDDGRITQTGSVTGTPGYVAPEILRDASEPTIEQWQDGDWFAWAAVLLSAATGRPPFGTGGADGILHRLFSGQPDTQGLSPHMGRAFKLALNPEPTLRVGPDELIAALAEETLADQYEATHFLDPFDTTRPVSQETFQETEVQETFAPWPSETSSLSEREEVSESGRTESFQQAPPQAERGQSPSGFENMAMSATDADSDAVQFHHLWPGHFVYRHPFAKPATLLSVLLLFALGWLPAVAGIVWILPAVGLLLLAQAIGRAEVQISTRRNTFGRPRKSDGAVAAVSVPWTLPVAFAVLLPSIAVGVVAFFLIWLIATLSVSVITGAPFDVGSLTDWVPQSTVESPYPWQVGPYPWRLGVASIGALLAAWAMPSSRWARIGLARIFGWIAPTTGLKWLWATLFVVTLGFLIAL